MIHHSIEVYRHPLGDDYRVKQTLVDQDEVQPLAFPNVVLKPSQLFGH